MRVHFVRSDRIGILERKIHIRSGPYAYGPNTMYVHGLEHIHVQQYNNGEQGKFTKKMYGCGVLSFSNK